MLRKITDALPLGEVVQGSPEEFNVPFVPDESDDAADERRFS